jgi:TolA-binding protein
MTRRHPARLVLMGVMALGVGVAAQPNNEEFARLQYESGVAFLENHRYTEAIKDLQAVVDSFSTSLVADDALLQIARYQLETAHDLDSAQEAVETLVKDYPDTDSAPMAHVLAGRIAFSRGRRANDLDGALASFERVPRLFPGNEAVAAADFYAGETLRSVRRDAEALERFRRVTMEFPHSIWAARAGLSAGYALVQQQKPMQALEEIQRARRIFPDSPVAAAALDLNSIIYRLYVRGAAQQPSHAFAGKTIGAASPSLRDVSRMLFDGDGRLLVGHKGGISIFERDGTAAETIPAKDATAFFVDEQNRFVVARGASLITARGDAITFSGPGSDGTLRAVGTIPAALANERGERLLSNPKARNVIVSLPNGRFLAVFATGNVSRMAQNWIGDVALLDRSAKTVAIVDQDGKAVSKIPSKGPGYEFRSPIDVTFDALDHIYVLDPGKSAIFVFGPKNALVTTLAIPDRGPGGLGRSEALAVDSAGRLYAFDSRSRRIQVYQ